MVANFYWNQAYIATVLCENKANPQLNCAGKCQLKKQLEAEQKKEQQLPALKWDGKEQVFSFAFLEAPAILYNGLLLPRFNNSMNGKLPGYVPSIFHPPAARG